MLVGLIAGEMANSWKDEESGILPDANDDIISGLSAADIFYAHINGEELYIDQSLRSGSLHSNGSIEMVEPKEEKDTNQSSFMELPLPLREGNSTHTASEKIIPPEDGDVVVG
jgi:hypothetical protein